jgi:NAD(P)-dependent dehydrogenase (short-subunit alcohol dehydrogenase family)
MYTVPDQTGRTFIVTGANSGTGKEASKRLAGAGAKVILAVRDPAKGSAARDEILQAHPKAKLEVRGLDLANLEHIREFAKYILKDKVKVDVLVNNAGVMVPPKRLTTTDGFELQFGTNFLGPFALTMLLLPRILESDAPRVATMSSIVANFGRINFDDLESEKKYNPNGAYGQSKLADLLFAQRLAAISSERGWSLVSTIAHPGFTRTNLQTAGKNLDRPGNELPPITSTFPIPSQGVEAGAEPLLFAAADPSAVSGEYYGPKHLALVGETKKASIPRSARRKGVPERLWTVAQELTGTSLPS